MASSKTLQAIVEIAGSLSPTLGKAAEEASKSLEGINLKAVAVGAGVAAAGAAIGKATIEAGKYLVDLGGQFDDVVDTIRIGTGATGDALDALTDDFNEVYKSVPTTMEDASQAIADYNTRLGLTGPELQNISKQAIQVSDMLGDDLGGVIEESSQAFQAWNIDAADMGDAMDYVFKASQSTGLGFTDLMSSVQQFAPQLQEMGYSFNEATALIGQLDKSDSVSYREIAVNGRYIRGYGVPKYSSKATSAGSGSGNGGGLKYSKGDIVNFTGSKHYASANATSGPSCKAGKAKVTNTAEGTKHPYHLIAVNGSGSTVYGWVNASDIAGASTAAASGSIEEGKTVKVKTSATKYATGQTIPSWVKSRKYTVQKIDGDRALLKEITSWVKVSDLELA